MKILKIAKFINFLMFLKTFEYRSLTERILKIKLFKVNKDYERYLEFTYINRVIVWNALGKALSSFLPFLDFKKIASFFASTSSITSYCDVDSSDLDNICGICQSSTLCMPHKTGVCPHEFCYYCITTHFISSRVDLIMDCTNISNQKVNNENPVCPVCKVELTEEISPAENN